MSYPTDDDPPLKRLLAQLAHTETEARKWRRLALKLGTAMRPLSSDAGPGDWQTAQRALQALDAETAR